MELPGAIELLEIEHRARSMIDGEEGFKLVEETAARLRIGKEARDPGRIDLPVGKILHHWQDQRTVHRGIDHRTAVAVGKDGELVVRSGYGHPHRSEPVEIANVTLQRGGRALVRW